VARRVVEPAHRSGQLALARARTPLDRRVDRHELRTPRPQQRDRRRDGSFARARAHALVIDQREVKPLAPSADVDAREEATLHLLTPFAPARQCRLCLLLR
jgi:hypothetical protein